MVVIITMVKIFSITTITMMMIEMMIMNNNNKDNNNIRMVMKLIIKISGII